MAPPSEEQRLWSEHLRYEHRMLRATHDLYAANQSGAVLSTDSGSLGCAILESFAIHARVLIEFLLRGGAASRFVSDWERKRATAFVPNLGRPFTKSFLDDIWERVDKEIAHLTPRRRGLEEEARVWNLTEVRDAIGRLLEVFSREATAECGFDPLDGSSS